MHTYAVPPEYYPVLKRFGDENPSIKDFMDKLIAGKFFLCAIANMVLLLCFFDVISFLFL